MTNNLSLTLFGLDLSQAEINVVLITCVVEITQEPSLSSEVAIVESSFGGAFASGSEISLHGRSARVEDADCVCIFGPMASEDLLKRIW